MTFTDNPLIAANTANYMAVTVDTARVLDSWRTSFMSYEWLDANGHIKAPADLKEDLRSQHLAMLKAVKDGIQIARPVLGIGIYDNVEIGIGRDIFVTLASLGLSQIAVHIPQSMARDFKAFVIN
ncbi:MAG: hypothetical protein V4621_01555 [Pseudomonadota bacterium]